jgi:hypothetical protein
MRILLIIAAISLCGCSGWAYKPGGPTDTAIEAGTRQINEQLDLNHDGIVSDAELVYGTKSAAQQNDWETLAWIAVAAVGAIGGAAAPVAHRMGKKRGFDKGLFTPVPMKGAPITAMKGG